MLWFILTLAILLIWAIPAFRSLQEMDCQPAPRWRIPFAHLIDEPEEAAIVFFLLGIVFAIGGYTILHGWGTWSDIVGDFYANIAMECISVAITVLIIERLYERRSKFEGEKAEKERLSLQMGSPDNAFAVEAVRQLAKRGWLTDGSLAGAYLLEANLHEADLTGATLSETNLTAVNLSSADLSYANLSGANLNNANLSEANLWKTNLSGANLDSAMLDSACLWEANLSNASLLGAYYTATTWPDKTRMPKGTLWPGGFDPKAAGAIEVEWNEELQEWIPVDDG